MSYYGVAGTVELPNAKSFDPRSGWTVTRKFRGTPTAIQTLSDNLTLDSTRHRVEPSEDGGYWILSAEYAAGDPQNPNATDPSQPLSDKWTLQGNDLEKSIWELPKVRAELDKVDEPADLATFKKALTDFVAGTLDEEDASIEDLIPATSPAIDIEVISDLFSSLVKGVEAYTVSQFVLRHTLLVSSNTTIRPAYTGVGKVYTTAQLTLAESIPTTILFALPAGVWLKRTPTVEPETWDKWQIVQEWWHADSYDPFIYEPIS